MKSPIRPTDAAARQQAKGLLENAQHAALAVMAVDDTHPTMSRIALTCTPNGYPMSLVSELSQHTVALAQNPACALLLGDPGTKGDPLTHARLSLQCNAVFIARNSPGFKTLLAQYLVQIPKAKLYANFTDFLIVRFEIRAGFLNAGFGKAYQLTAADLGTQNKNGLAQKDEPKT